jgi:hypothetical protein
MGLWITLTQELDVHHLCPARTHVGADLWHAPSFAQVVFACDLTEYRLSKQLGQGESGRSSFWDVQPFVMSCIRPFFCNQRKQTPRAVKD